MDPTPASPATAVPAPKPVTRAVEVRLQLAEEIVTGQLSPGAALDGPHLGYVRSPEQLALKPDGTAARIDKAVAHVTGTKMKSQAAGKMGFGTKAVGDLVVAALA